MRNQYFNCQSVLPLSNIVLTPKFVGVIHNNLLQACLTKFPRITERNYEAIIPLMINYCSREIDQISKENYFSIQSQIQGLYFLQFFKHSFLSLHFMQKKYDDLLTKLSLLSIISIQGQVELEKFKNVLFSTSFSRQIIDEINFDYTSLNAIEGELLSNLVNMYISSGEFWLKIRTDNDVNPSRLLVGDCLGYIGGWGSAAWDDWWNDNLNPSGQGRRIGQGLIWGAIGSAAPILIKAIPETPIFTTDAQNNKTKIYNGKPENGFYFMG